jgi:phosphoserine aminotransferase
MNKSLLLGKNFTVGPAKLYRGVENNIIENLKNGYASLSHRSREFSNISKEGMLYFRKFFNIPDNYKVYYTYSATEGLELSIRGLANKKSIHYINGTFGWVWANIARKNGKKTIIKEEIFGNRAPLNFSKSEINDCDIACVTANETSSGIEYSAEEISKFSKKLPKKTLLAVDVTSSMGGISYDFSSADIWAFSVQKAFGLPAGLGILLVSPRAYEKSEEHLKNNQEGGNHHSFTSLEKKMLDKFQTPTTPNVLGIFSFKFINKKFIEDFFSIKNVDKKTEEKAKLLYDFFDNHPKFKSFILDKNKRSKTIIIIESTIENIRDKKKYLESKGVLLGSGYGLYKSTQFRIANFPVHTIEDMEYLISCF